MPSPTFLAPLVRDLRRVLGEPATDVNLILLDNLRGQIREWLPADCHILTNILSHRMFLRLDKAEDYYRLPRVLVDQADRIYYVDGRGEVRVLKDRDGTVDVHLLETPPPLPVVTVYDHLLDD